MKKICCSAVHGAITAAAAFFQFQSASSQRTAQHSTTYSHAKKHNCRYIFFLESSSGNLTSNAVELAHTLGGNLAASAGGSLLDNAKSLELVNSLADNRARAHGLLGGAETIVLGSTITATESTDTRARAQVNGTSESSCAYAQRHQTNSVSQSHLLCSSVGTKGTLGRGGGVSLATSQGRRHTAASLTPTIPQQQAIGKHYIPILT